MESPGVASRGKPKETSGSRAICIEQGVSGVGKLGAQNA